MACQARFTHTHTHTPDEMQSAEKKPNRVINALALESWRWEMGIGNRRSEIGRGEWRMGDGQCNGFYAQLVLVTCMRALKVRSRSELGVLIIQHKLCCAVYKKCISLSWKSITLPNLCRSRPGHFTHSHDPIKRKMFYKHKRSTTTDSMTDLAQSPLKLN